MFVIFLSALLFCAFSPSNAEGRLRQFFKVNLTTINKIDAERECSHNHSNLVTVYDQQDNYNLVQLLRKDNSSKLGWIGVYSGNRSIKWSNGDDVTYAQDKYKSNINSSQGTLCATMKADGNWESIECSQTKFFMCYKQEAGETSYNYTLITENKTWFDAQLYCRGNHTDLVSIGDDKVNQLVNETGATSNNPFWIGLLDDTAEWIDGGRSAYRNWDSSSPKKNHTHISFTYLWSTAGGNHVPLCQKSFIRISDLSMSWKEAMDYCNKYYFRPLCIESKNDQTETERELRRLKISKPVWVGLRQSQLFGFWVWNNGLQVESWTIWKGVITPEHQLSQHCGAIEMVDGQYKMSDKDCRRKFRVLCEIE